MVLYFASLGSNEESDCRVKICIINMEHKRKQPENKQFIDDLLKLCNKLLSIELKVIQEGEEAKI